MALRREQPRVRRHPVMSKEVRHIMWTNAYGCADLGEFLKEARRSKGITQAEMARRLGVATTTLSALETGKNVSSDTVARDLQLLGFRMVIVPKNARVTVDERPLPFSMALASTPGVTNMDAPTSNSIDASTPAHSSQDGLAADTEAHSDGDNS